MTLSLSRTYPDVYFTPGYGASAAVIDEGTWHEVDAGDGFLLPYVRRDLAAGLAGDGFAGDGFAGDGFAGGGLARGGLADAVSPYGYCGIAVRPGADPAAGWAAARAAWREQGIVTVFLRFSPMDPDSLAAARGLAGLRLTRRGDTVLVPTADGPDAMWQRMASRSRNMVRKATRAGLHGRIRPATAGDLAGDAPFRRLYLATMDRVGGAAKYRFPDRYYRLLADGVGPALHLAEVLDEAGDVVASSLVLEHDRLAHYHLACSAPEGARLGANNVLVWTILCWAHERGIERVHLGGGVTAGDSLFAFKSSFGGQPAPFWTGTVVTDPVAEERLTRARATALGRTVEQLRATSFFPSYRAA